MICHCVVMVVARGVLVCCCGYCPGHVKVPVLLLLLLVVVAE